MKLIISKQFQEFIRGLDLPLDDLLKRASIPNLLWKEQLELSSTDYYKLLQEFDRIVTDSQLLAFSQIESIHTFLPPFYAALSSKNGREAIQRFAAYKRLVGPVKVEIQQSVQQQVIRFSYLEENNVLPRFALLNEQLLLISLLRTGTKDPTIMPTEIKGPYRYGESLNFMTGSNVRLSKKNELCFSQKDLEKPFYTQNNTMLDFLEPELKRRMEELSTVDSFSDYVQKELFSAIPSGQFTLENISNTLGLSPRSLQRKLKAEQTTFNTQLKIAQEHLATHYLKKTSLPTIDIAYLVGYTEISSFARAFKNWTGKTIAEVKNSSDS
ncbi:helix-turn-helix transcriptional regulator [Enterococcus sp. LJL128]|uniref:helix-turn-helix transcriptional regulator n=1 Tax=Enterococcus sp. LJL51 TaxID=3416656 RepID=UPI003CF58C3C